MQTGRLKLDFISFKAKALVSLLLALILLLSLLITVMLHFQRKTIQEQMRYINYERSNQTTEQFELIYEQINSVSNLLFLDEDIEEILRTGRIYNYGQMAADQEKISILKKRYNTSIPKLDLHLTVIADDYRLYGDGSYDKNVALTIIEKQWWYQELLLSPWQTLWIQDEYLDQLHGTSDTKYIYSIRFLKRFDNWENQGLLIVSFLESDLIKLYANTVPAGGSVFLTGRNGRLISMIDNAGVYSAGILKRIPEGYSADSRESIDGVDYQIVSNTVRTPLWQAITVTPEQQLRVQFRGSNTLLIVMVLLFFVILAIFSQSISRFIVKPIETFTKDVQEIGKSKDISHRIPAQSKDEIGILALEFNSMMDRIEELMNSVVTEQAAKRYAELQSLCAQINPHFIYNTLTSIRFLIIAGDTVRADAALHDFTRLLRSTISTDEELCSIRLETDLLQEYINIQQLFFDEPFRVVWDVAPELLYCKIIKLTLQPIVENAVLHGLKSKEGDRVLIIRIVPDGADILITISDNGIGTDKHPEFCDSGYGKSIGLKNVHNRIVLHFGAPYGLQFSSVPGQGTAVKMLIPRIENKREFM